MILSIQIPNSGFSTQALKPENIKSQKKRSPDAAGQALLEI